MVIERLPARVRTPAVARAATSPSALLLAGAGASAVILGGLPLVAAPIVGVAAWLARVAFAVPRSSGDRRIDAFAVQEPWRGFVRDAQQAKVRYDQVVRAARSGPLRDRLTDVGHRLDDGVREAWRIACQGDALEKGMRTLDVRSINDELARVIAERAHHGGGASTATTASLDRAEQAIRAQLATATRLRHVADDARNRLRVLNAQLDEAVARAVELGLHAGDARALQPLSDDVDNVVGELESLRQALEATSAPAGPSIGT